MANKLVYEAGGRKIEIEFVKPPERGPRCETCRFYSGAQEREDGGEWREAPFGQCLRLPPRASTNRRECGFWPKVLSDHWCGEHEPSNQDS